MSGIRASLKRRFSHKDKEVNFDDVDSADEETQEYITKEVQAAESDEKYPLGKPGSLLNRLIMHGNKKTEEEIARGWIKDKEDARKNSTAA